MMITRLCYVHVFSAIATLSYRKSHVVANKKARWPFFYKKKTTQYQLMMAQRTAPQAKMAPQPKNTPSVEKAQAQGITAPMGSTQPATSTTVPSWNPALDPQLIALNDEIRKAENVKRCHLHTKDMKNCKACRKYKEAGGEVERLKKERESLMNAKGKSGGGVGLMQPRQSRIFEGMSLSLFTCKEFTIENHINATRCRISRKWVCH